MTGLFHEYELRLAELVNHYLPSIEVYRALADWLMEEGRIDEALDVLQLARQSGRRAALPRLLVTCVTSRARSL